VKANRIFFNISER